MCNMSLIGYTDFCCVHIVNWFLLSSFSKHMMTTLISLWALRCTFLCCYFQNSNIFLASGCPLVHNYHLLACCLSSCFSFFQDNFLIIIGHKTIVPHIHLVSMFFPIAKEGSPSCLWGFRLTVVVTTTLGL
jgi:hypothetical protein